MAGRPLSGVISYGLRPLAGSTGRPFTGRQSLNQAGRSGRPRVSTDVSAGAEVERSAVSARKLFIESVVFTCQFCSERQEWDTREAADPAAAWHLFEIHPLRWRATAGDRCSTDLRPTRLGHRLAHIGSV